MKRIAVFPGSFDPITRGHQDVVERASGLFDEIIVAIGHNTTKQTMFSLTQRLEWLKVSFDHLENVRVDAYEGLTVEYCKKNKAHYLLRGVRNSGDYEYESTIGHMNTALWAEMETVLFISHPMYSSVHSTVIREILKNKGDVSQFIPTQIRIDF